MHVYICMYDCVVYICMYDCVCEFRRIKSVLASYLSGDKVSLLPTAAYTRVSGSQASEACPISAGMTDMLYPVWF